LDEGKIEYLEQVAFLLIDQEFGENEEASQESTTFEENVNK